jgi:DNA-binding NtrC family response regulator
VDAIPVPEEPAQRQTQRPTETGTILLVEDEAALRRMMHEYFVASGYNVLDAGNSATALELARQYTGAIHILVTDVILPGTGGPQLSREIKEMHPETKVLFISGYAPEFLSGREHLGHDRLFLAKPFSREALLQKVREALANSAGVR